MARRPVGRRPRAAAAARPAADEALPPQEPRPLRDLPGIRSRQSTARCAAAIPSRARTASARSAANRRRGPPRDEKSAAWWRRWRESSVKNDVVERPHVVSDARHFHTRPSAWRLRAERPCREGPPPRGGLRGPSLPVWKATGEFGSFERAAN